MATKEKKAIVFESCEYRLHGHYPKSIQKTLLEIANNVDPHWSPDHYGSGDSISRFESELSQLLGMEAALFFPSGTMAQQIALRYWSDQTGNPNIGMHMSCHLEVHEEMGYRILHGLNGFPVGTLNQSLSIQDLDSISEKIGSIVVELPQRHSGGALPSWEELCNLSRWAQQRNIVLHLDGARLWETSAYYKQPYSKICSLFDSVYISFYKGLGAVGGAALLGSTRMIKKARVWQRRHGGNLVHLFPLYISAWQGLKVRLPRMEAYFKKAQEIHKIIGLQSEMETVQSEAQSNMMHLTFSRSKQAVEEAMYQVAVETGIFVGSSVWDREIADQPVFELYVGDGALDLSRDQITLAIESLNNKLKNS